MLGLLRRRLRGTDMPVINNDMSEARLRAAFIQDLRNFVDNTDAIHAAVDSDLYWFPEMLDFARRADDLATRLDEASPRRKATSDLNMAGLPEGIPDAVSALTNCPENGDIATVLNDPTASYWLKRALWSAMNCDPVDVANDCEWLSALLGKRANSILSVAIEEFGGSPEHESL